jgi:hypothetical protein
MGAPLYGLPCTKIMPEQKDRQGECILELGTLRNPRGYTNREVMLIRIGHFLEKRAKMKRIRRRSWCLCSGGALSIMDSPLLLSSHVLLSTLCALSLVASAVASTSLLKPLANWSLLHNTSADNSYRIGVDPSMRLNGKPSGILQSEKKEQSTDHYALIWQSFDAKAYLGKRVQFSGMIKSRDTNGWTNGFLKVTENGSVVQFDNMDNRRLASADDWQPFSIVLDVPKTASSISLGVHLAGGGTAWLNGLSFQAVGKELPTTAIAWDAKKFHDYLWENLDDEPHNLDFSAVRHVQAPARIMEWAVTDPGDYEIFVDKDTTFNGKVGACLRSRKDEPSDFALLSQDFNAAKYRGKRLKFSAYAKAKDVKDWAGLMMRVKGSQSVLAFDNMEDRPIKGTHDWQPYSLVLDVPEQSTVVRIGFLLAGSGSIWFSNARLDAVGSTIPVTQKTIELDKLPIDKTKLQPDLEFKE